MTNHVLNEVAFNLKYFQKGRMECSKDDENIINDLDNINSLGLNGLTVDSETAEVYNSFEEYGDFNDSSTCSQQDFKKYMHSYTLDDLNDLSEIKQEEKASETYNDQILDLINYMEDFSFFINEESKPIENSSELLDFGQSSIFQISDEEIIKNEYSSLQCYDLFQSLTLAEDIGDIRLNNKNRLKWKRSNMRRHCLMELGVPFDIDEAIPKEPPSLDKMAANGYSMKDMEFIAGRLDTTLSLSLCNISQNSLNTYSHTDLYKLSKLIEQTLDEVSLSIEYWRSKIKEVEEGQEMYHKMIANLVSHTHKSKQTYFSKPTTSISKS